MLSSHCWTSQQWHPSRENNIDGPLVFPFFLGRSQTALPAFERLQHAVAFGLLGPHRFALFQADLVLALAFAIVGPAKVWRGGDPHHAVERHVFIIHNAENRHFSCTLTYFEINFFPAR